MLRGPGRKQQMESIYNHFLHYVETLVGTGATFTDDLERVGKSLFKSKFAGVFPKDQIPTTRNFQYAIINLDDHDDPGSHWIAVSRLGTHTNEGYLVYDSFGRPTSDILPGMPFVTEDTDPDAEQRLDEDNCGARALTWLLIVDLYGPAGGRQI